MDLKICKFCRCTYLGKSNSDGYCSNECRDLAAGKKVKKSYKERRKSELERFVGGMTAYNKEHGINLSYGKYVAKTEGRI